MQFNSMFATMCVSDKNEEIKADFCLEVSLEYFFPLLSWLQNTDLLLRYQRTKNFMEIKCSKLLFQHWLACHGQSVEINTFKEVAGGRGIPEKKKKEKIQNSSYFRFNVMMEWTMLLVLVLVL